MSLYIAIVGYGYWGPNLLRAFVNNSECSVKYCCDLNRDLLKDVKRRFPYIEITDDFRKVLSDKRVKAIVIATPTTTHFVLARQAILAGKDVLVEKPMTYNLREAHKLVALARKHKRILMVDHVLLFNPAVIKIKELIDKGEIGRILYIDTARTNLGLFQKDVNVIFDLGAHEFSVIQYLLGSKPKIISCVGKSHINKHIDVAYITAKYPKNIIAHVHVTWLSPLKIRRMFIVGNKKMIVYDDNDQLEKVKVYDKGIIKMQNPEDHRRVKVGYRVGDVWSPNVEFADALNNLTQDFINAIISRKVVRSDGKLGAQVVGILEEATRLFK